MLQTIPKTVALNDFLLPHQIAVLVTMWEDRDSKDRFSVRAKEYLTTIMPQINGMLGQENDPGYLAYACEFIFMKTMSRKV